MATVGLSLQERLMRDIEPVTESGCWLSLSGIMKAGYSSYRQNNKTFYAHRISYEMHKGPIPGGGCVLHRCDVRCCVNPAHLFVGSKLDNTRDMESKGRGNLFKPKLTEQQVLDMVAMYRSGIGMRKAAAAFGVTKTSLQYILTGRSWKHLNVAQ